MIARRWVPRRAARRALSLAAATTLLGLAPGARAEATAEDEARARVLYEEGTALLDAGATAEACPKLEEAVRLVPDASGAHLALGVCFERSGRLASALHHLERAEALSDPATLAERRRRAAEAAAALRPRVGHIVVELAPGTPGTATTTLDGASARHGASLPVDAGAHEVVVSDDGVILARRSVLGRDGEVVRVELGRAAPAPAAVVDGTSSPTPERGTPDDGAPWREIGVVALAVGGAGLVLGGVSAAVAAERDAASDDACDARDFCSAAGFAARDEAFTWATVSTLGFIAGGAFAATGVVLVLVDDAGGETETATPDRAGAARAEAALVPGGIRVRGTF